MALYLVQHGKSLSKELDPKKGLSEEGRAEVERIAEVAKNYAVQVSEIRHSGKTRALQTAQIFSDILMPAGGVSEIEGIKALDDVVAFSARIDFKANMMLVGHLPFMEKLVSHIITKNTDIPVFKFQNGGILCVARDEATGTPVIRWALMPHIK